MSVAQKAHDLVLGERQSDYGDPRTNLAAIADFWSTYLNRAHLTGLALEPADVCAMMRLLKEARLINNPSHTDSLVDVCGYAVLQDMVTRS